MPSPRVTRGFLVLLWCLNIYDGWCAADRRTAQGDRRTAELQLPSSRCGEGSYDVTPHSNLTLPDCVPQQGTTGPMGNATSDSVSGGEYWLPQRRRRVQGSSEQSRLPSAEASARTSISKEMNIRILNWTALALFTDDSGRLLPRRGDDDHHNSVDSAPFMPVSSKAGGGDDPGSHDNGGEASTGHSGAEHFQSTTTPVTILTYTLPFTLVDSLINADSGSMCSLLGAVLANEHGIDVTSTICDAWDIYLNGDSLEMTTKLTIITQSAVGADRISTEVAASEPASIGAALQMQIQDDPPVPDEVKIAFQTAEKIIDEIGTVKYDGLSIVRAVHGVLTITIENIQYTNEQIIGFITEMLVQALADTTNTNVSADNVMVSIHRNTSIRFTVETTGDLAVLETLSQSNIAAVLQSVLTTSNVDIIVNDVAVEADVLGTPTIEFALADQQMLGDTDGYKFSSTMDSLSAYDSAGLFAWGMLTHEEALLMARRSYAATYHPRCRRRGRRALRGAPQAARISTEVAASERASITASVRTRIQNDLLMPDEEKIAVQRAEIIDITETVTIRDPGVAAVEGGLTVTVQNTEYTNQQIIGFITEMLVQALADTANTTVSADNIGVSIRSSTSIRFMVETTQDLAILEALSQADTATFLQSVLTASNVDITIDDVAVDWFVSETITIKSATFDAADQQTFTNVDVWNISLIEDWAAEDFVMATAFIAASLLCLAYILLLLVVYFLLLRRHVSGASKQRIAGGGSAGGRRRGAFLGAAKAHSGFSHQEQNTPTSAEIGVKDSQGPLPSSKQRRMAVNAKNREVWAGATKAKKMKNNVSLVPTEPGKLDRKRVWHACAYKNLCDLLCFSSTASTALKDAIRAAITYTADHLEVIAGAWEFPSDALSATWGCECYLAVFALHHGWVFFDESGVTSCYGVDLPTPRKVECLVPESTIRVSLPAVEKEVHERVGAEQGLVAEEDERMIDVGAEDEKFEKPFALIGWVGDLQPLLLQAGSCIISR